MTGIRQEFFSLGEILLSKYFKKLKMGKKMDLIHQRNSSSLSFLHTFGAAAGLQQDGSPATHPGTDHPHSKEKEREQKGEEKEEAEREEREDR